MFNLNLNNIKDTSLKKTLRFLSVDEIGTSDRIKAWNTVTGETLYLKLTAEKPVSEDGIYIKAFNVRTGKIMWVTKIDDGNGGNGGDEVYDIFANGILDYYSRGTLFTLGKALSEVIVQWNVPQNEFGDTLVKYQAGEEIQHIFKGTNLGTVTYKIISGEIEVTSSSFWQHVTEIRGAKGGKSPFVFKGSIFCNGTSHLRYLWEEIFNNSPDLEDVRNLFNNSEIREIPVNLFSNNPKLKNVDYCFASMCIIDVPEDIFKNNPEIETANNLFADSSITEVKRWFKYSKKIKYLEQCFESCDGITEVPFDLFYENEELLSLKSAFSYTNIKEIDKGFLSKNKKLTDISLMFSNTKITEFPENFILSNATEIKVDNLFNNFIKVNYNVIHPDNTAKITGCNSMFGSLGVTKLSRESVLSMFSNFNTDFINSAGYLLQYEDTDYITFFYKSDYGWGTASITAEENLVVLSKKINNTGFKTLNVSNGSNLSVSTDDVLMIKGKFYISLVKDNSNNFRYIEKLGNLNAVKIVTSPFTPNSFVFNLHNTELNADFLSRTDLSNVKDVILGVVGNNMDFLNLLNKNIVTSIDIFIDGNGELDIQGLKGFSPNTSLIWTSSYCNYERLSQGSATALNGLTIQTDGFHRWRFLKEIPEGFFENAFASNFIGNDEYSEMHDYFHSTFNLKYLPDLKIRKTVTSLGGFLYLSSVEKAHPNNFRDYPLMTWTKNLFFHSMLNEVPEGYMSNCPILRYTNFDFYGSRIKDIPEGMWGGTTNLVSFNGAFYCCHILETIPQNLFFKHKKIVDLSLTLGDTPRLRRLYPNMFDIQTSDSTEDYEEFDGMNGYLDMTQFMCGSSISEIPDNFMTIHNPIAIYMSDAFYSCGFLNVGKLSDKIKFKNGVARPIDTSNAFENGAFTTFGLNYAFSGFPETTGGSSLTVKVPKGSVIDVCGGEVSVIEHISKRLNKNFNDILTQEEINSITWIGAENGSINSDITTEINNFGFLLNFPNLKYFSLKGNNVQKFVDLSDLNSIVNFEQSFANCLSLNEIIFPYTDIVNLHKVVDNCPKLGTVVIKPILNALQTPIGETGIDSKNVNVIFGYDLNVTSIEQITPKYSFASLDYRYLPNLTNEPILPYPILSNAPILQNNISNGFELIGNVLISKPIGHSQSTRGTIVFDTSSFSEDVQVQITLKCFYETEPSCDFGTVGLIDTGTGIITNKIFEFSGSAGAIQFLKETFVTKKTSNTLHLTYSKDGSAILGTDNIKIYSCLINFYNV